MSSSEYPQALSYIQSGGDASLKPTQAQQLEFYGLFKQIFVGPNTTKAPSRLKLIDHAKWNAWNKLGKISKEEAQKKYVALLDKADPKWREKVKKNAKESESKDNANIRSKL